MATKAKRTATKAGGAGETTKRPIDALGEKIAAAMIAAMEQGTAPWVKPWDATTGAGGFGIPRNAVSGKAYRGGNVFYLWAQAQARGYTAPRWLTFKQAKAAGGSVRKGEKGTEVFFFRPLERDEKRADGTIERRKVWLARVYYVFNVAQCDGLADRVMGITPAAPEAPEADPVVADAATMRAWADATERGICPVALGGDRAAYSPALDRIILPALADFRSVGDGAAVALHENIHATGHESRTDRLKAARFGSDTYAKEELVAELGSAILCAAYGIPGQLQHAAYLDHWIKVLRETPDFVLTAASAAQKAVDLCVAQWGLSLDETPAGGAEDEDDAAAEAA